MSNIKFKDPDARVDFTVDWSAWLDGDAIENSAWVVPDGITRYAATNTATSATVWLSGGAEGQQYALVNRITTAGGRINDQTLIIRIRSR